MKNSISHSNKPKTKLVDVIIPSYNHGRFLRTALQSVVTQSGSYLNQIFVVDDGSTDDTRKVVEEMEQKYGNIRYLHQKNKGLSSARNLGIKNAKSPYIAFLDADDIWEKTKIVKQVSRFMNDNNPHLGIVYCDYNDIDVEGEKIDLATQKLDTQAKGNVYQKLLGGNYIAGSGSGVLVRRECFTKCGYFDESLPSCEDWDMWLRISRKYEVGYVNEKLLSIRRTSSSLSTDERKMAIGAAMLCEKNPDILEDKVGQAYVQSIVSQAFAAEFPLHNTAKRLRSTVSKMTYQKTTSLTPHFIRNYLAKLANRLVVNTKRLFT